MSSVRQSQVGFITIIAKNYLAQARVLMASVEKYHPDSRRLVVLTDEVEDCFDPAQESFQVVRSSELELPDPKWFHFRYSILELTTGVKPFVLRHAFGLLGVENLIYLDADIRLFAALDPVLSAFDEANIVLTPHLLDRVDGDEFAVERQLLQTGAYNLGFIAVRRGADADSFLSWWCDRLAEHCLVDLAAGLFVDQKWVDLVPGMFDGVRILREPGLNVAWWNLPERPLLREGEDYRAAGEPLYFFHFSGFDPDQPERLSKHAAGGRASAPGPVKELLRDYAESLLSSGHRTSKSWTPFFESFEDGSSIPRPVRKALELQPTLRQQIDDPFSATGREQIVEFWNRQVEAPTGSGFLTRLAYQIYRTEAQVQASMPDVFGADRDAYVTWFLSEGAARYGLPPELTTPLNESARDAGRARLSPLALAIYESRRDLQRAFPEPFEKDALALLTWLLTYGEKECDIDAANRRALRLEFERLLERVDSPLERWSRRAKFALLARSAARQS